MDECKVELSGSYKGPALYLIQQVIALGLGRAEDSETRKAVKKRKH